MNKQELEQAICKVAESIGKSKEEVAAKLLEKDSWMWFLVREAA